MKRFIVVRWLCSFTILLVVGLSLAPTVAAQSFKRGDTNADSQLDLGDPIFTLVSLFVGDQTPSCEDAADATDDGKLNLADALYTLMHLFVRGNLLPAPGMECGEDPTLDTLDCVLYAHCAPVDPPVSGHGTG